MSSSLAAATHFHYHVYTSLIQDKGQLFASPSVFTELSGMYVKLQIKESISYPK